MSYAVTGATGHLGGIAVRRLLARGIPAAQVVALVRDPARAADLAALGVDVRRFDYDEPTTLAPALTGVDALLLVSGSEVGRRVAQHTAVIDAAAAAGVHRLVYTSGPHADTSINPLMPEHAATEAYLAAAGLPHLVLRNGWYNENYVGALDEARATGVLLTATGEGRVASAARADYAEAAANALAGDETGVLTLTGDVAWTYDDLAALVAQVLGREVHAEHVTVEEKVARLVAAGVPEGGAAFGAGIDAAIAAGELGDLTGDLHRLLGHPTTPLADTLRAAA
jgi:NAD(P)H dehydrogenase (quinone)